MHHVGSAENLYGLLRMMRALIDESLIEESVPTDLLILDVAMESVIALQLMGEPYPTTLPASTQVVRTLEFDGYEFTIQTDILVKDTIKELLH